MNEKQPWAEAIAVKGSQIVFVGDPAGAKAFTGKGNKTIDTTGKIVMPGFVDAHDHLIGSGWTSKGVHLFVPIPKKTSLMDMEQRDILIVYGKAEMKVHLIRKVKNFEARDEPV